MNKLYKLELEITKTPQLAYNYNYRVRFIYDCLFPDMFFPTVTCPTHITETSSRLIHNIITNASLVNPRTENNMSPR